MEIAQNITVSMYLKFTFPLHKFSTVFLSLGNQIFQVRSFQKALLVLITKIPAKNLNSGNIINCNNITHYTLINGKPAPKNFTFSPDLFASIL